MPITPDIETRQLALAGTCTGHSRAVGRLHVSRFQTAQHAAQLVPAAHLRPGLETEPIPMRGGRSADRRPGAAAPGGPAASHKTRVNALMVTQDARERAYVTQRAGALARRPCVPQRRNARLSALHHGDFGSGFRASISGIASRSVQRSSSQPGRSAWRADFPTLSRVSVTSRHPRDAIPSSAFRIVSRKRPS